MMRRQAFTLLEVIIALALSSFILFALAQAYRSAVGFLYKSRASMVLNRKVCLLFNQIERDLTTAFIPFLQPEITPSQDAAAKKNEQINPVDKKSDAVQKDDAERLKDFFLGTHSETMLAAFRYNDHVLKPFERITFICTNPLLVYGNSASRLVRVAYEVEKERFPRGFEHESYKIVRKEGRDLSNAAMKINQFDYAERDAHPIDTQVMIEGVKACYVQYITYKEEIVKEQGSNSKKKYEEIRSHTWGDKDFSKGVVPAALEITIILWTRDYTGEQLYHTMIPIFSYPTEKPQKSASFTKGVPQPVGGQTQGVPGAQGGVRQIPGTPGSNASLPSFLPGQRQAQQTQQQVPSNAAAMTRGGI